MFGELDGFSPTIVEVETEDGLVGFGEAPTWAAAAVVNDVLAPRLIGRDAFDIAGAEEVCLPFWTGVQSINDRTRIMGFGAIEVALWDLRGKAAGLPVHRLLGGKVRDKVRTYRTLYQGEVPGGAEHTPEGYKRWAEYGK